MTTEEDNQPVQSEPTLLPPQGEPKPKHAGGRPLKIATVEELQAKIDAYFAECDPHIVDGIALVKDEKTNELIEGTIKRFTDQKPYTVTGLAVFLDTSRETLMEYSERPEFVDTIKAAKDKIHSYAEQSLWTARNAAGPIFNLKNNWGWKDKSEVDQNLSGKLTIADLVVKARDERDRRNPD